MLVAIVHKGDLKYSLICAQVSRLHTDILMGESVYTIPAFDSVRIPLCRYTL